MSGKVWKEAEEENLKLKYNRSIRSKDSSTAKTLVRVAVEHVSRTW
jgi:hypothetical protein